jgi:hypothetical protein
LNRKPIIRKVLREALGVPNNIYDVSKSVYQRILSWVENLDESDFKDGEGANKLFRVNLRIADYHFSSLKVKLGVEEHKKVKEPEIMSMIFRSESQKTEDLKLEPIKKKTVDLIIIMVVPLGYDYDELQEFFVSNQNDIVESISHELKHAYDHFKKLYDSPQEKAEYQATIQLGFGFEPLDRFVHDIYFSSANENLVRPTEVASAIQNNKISQKGFIDFLKSNDIYRNLKRISSFNLENFKQDILRDEKKLKKVLKAVKMKPNKMSDEEKIDAVFKILYATISNARISNFQEILTHNFFEQLMGFEGEKQKVFERFIKRNQRFENPEDFVKYYEKYFHYIGDRMLRKIAKLYAITGK